MSGSTHTIVVKHSEGFTYVAVLMLLFVTGIALTGACYSWTTIVQREKEAELLFRGNQIRVAIERYVKNSPDENKPGFPKRLKDLLLDPRYPSKERYLRKIYMDPMTENGKWGLILEKNMGIRGVHSLSLNRPIKKGNFLEENQNFKTAKSYSEWKFIFTAKEKKVAGNKNGEPSKNTNKE